MQARVLSRSQLGVKEEVTRGERLTRGCESQESGAKNNLVS